MLKLILATVAVIFTVLFVFGDESRRDADSKNKRGSGFAFSLASFIPQPNEINEIELKPASSLSDFEAVKIAFEAGELLRAKNSGVYGEDIVASTSAIEPTTAGNDTAADFWYVSGAQVNLRAGPGTANEVVSRLGLGTQAEVLSDTSADWIEIRTADGRAGWISSKFLTQTAPG